MHHNQVRLLLRFSKILGHRAKDERVADPMEAVLSQSAPLRNILVDGVRANMFGKSLVKRRIEICDIWDLWILLSTSPNDFKCAEIVSAKKKKKIKSLTSVEQP